jgi:Flp pilus assembly pilin Flp
MIRQMAGLLRDESGATAVEYAIFVALIALVVVAAVGALGQAVLALFAEPQLDNALR